MRSRSCSRRRNSSRCRNTPPWAAADQDLRVGYETYGKLNAAGDNACSSRIFSPAPRTPPALQADDRLPATGTRSSARARRSDTDKYFVVSADTLVNLNVKSPAVAPPGPRPSNPDTASPTARHSPVVRCATSFACTSAHRSLGIRKLKGGGRGIGRIDQAMEWGAAYPELVERVIHVIGPGLDIHP